MTGNIIILEKICRQNIDHFIPLKNLKSNLVNLMMRISYNPILCDKENCKLNLRISILFTNIRLYFLLKKESEIKVGKSVLSRNRKILKFQNL